MAREKFKTLTEQMYYVLIALQEERCGVDVMEVVREMTNNRLKIGPGTLYSDRVVRFDIGVKLNDTQKAIVCEKLLAIE